MTAHIVAKSELAAIEALAQETLKPLADKIDREGFYPKEFLHQFGALGGFSLHSVQWYFVDLDHLFNAIVFVGAYCVSTSFFTWCYAVFAWYLQNCRVIATCELYFGRVVSGAVLTGT